VKKEDYNIAKVGGFMLKHLRAGTDISTFKNEFIYIRHGHYDKLIDSVQKMFPNTEFKSPIVVGYSKGTITTDNFSQKTQCDWVGLVNCNKPMAFFGQKLKAKYGLITDPEFPTQVFNDIILFELGIRSGLCNQYKNRDWDHNKITDEKTDLEPAIDEVCELRNISNEDKEALHLGRQFRNYIKKQVFKSQHFSTAEEGLLKFYKAIEVVQKHEISLY
jgi:hypothetical protein